MNKFLRNIISFSLKNRFFILFCTVLLLITGIITFRNMPIEAFPDVTNTEISIITQWPGRSAEEIEKFVTIPVEIAMNPVQQKISLRSTSIFGLSYVKLIFEDGSWVCYRLSGTEPVVRVYSEARSQNDADALSTAAKDWVLQ